MANNDLPIRECVLVEVTKDKMLGVISFTAPENGGKKLSIDEVRLAIKDKGIIQGINEQDLIEICKEHQYNYKYIIAKGKPPVEGKDGVIAFEFDIEELKAFKPKENTDGTVDFRELGSVKNVKQGEVLARRIPAIQGELGYNVLGQEIKPKKAQEARMPRGRNTAILEDNITLVSQIEGKLEYDDYNVYINPVYTLFGDVDSSIGNIDFFGSVVIEGNVYSGFTIKAGGSVEIKGMVEDAIIIAGEDIILHSGVQGTSKSKVVAEGNVISKFIQNANVKAGKNVISEAILHSVITAGDSIKVDIGKGIIIGGNINANNMIMARNIGSVMGILTNLEIGMPSNAYTEYKQLQLEIRQKQESITKIEHEISFLTAKRKVEELDSQKSIMLEKFERLNVIMNIEYEELKIRYHKLGEEMNNVERGLIKSDMIYHGVKIIFGKLITQIDNEHKNVIISKKDGQICIN